MYIYVRLRDIWKGKERKENDGVRLYGTVGFIPMGERIGRNQQVTKSE